MKVVPVTRSFLPPLEEYVKEIECIWQSHWLTNQGPLHSQFEESLKNYLGVQGLTLFTNGHLALDIAIKALGLSGEVITTPFTFASTTHVITLNGLKPVFCDIKREDLTINESKIEGLITPRTSAILAVHVYGNPCNVQMIDAVAKRHGLRVVYDAAHAFGEKISGLPITDFGDISMYSFHATKVFHTIEGGALVYRNLDLKKSLELLKNFGITGPETVERVGLNAKMNEFQAAMGIVNLRYINDEIKKRQCVAAWYESGLFGIHGLAMIPRRKDVVYNNSYFPILINRKEYGIDRNRLFERLAEVGFMTRKYFYPLITDFHCYSREFGATLLPVARAAADSVLALPMYGDLEEVEVEQIIDIIIQNCRKNA